MKARILVTGNNPQTITAVIKGDGPHKVTNTGSVLIPFKRTQDAQSELYWLHYNLTAKSIYHKYNPKSGELIFQGFHLSILKP
jgi:hypothetical protein